MTNIFGITGIVIGITNLAIGCIVYFYDKKNRTKQWWVLFAVSVSIWGFGSYIITITSDPIQALFWWRIAHIGVILIPFSFLIFTYNFLGKQTRLKTSLLLLLAVFFQILNTTPYFISQVRFVFNSFYYDGPPTLLYKIFFFTFVLGMLQVIILAIASYRKSTDPSTRRQLLFFALAATVGSLGGSTSFLPVFGLDVYPYFNASIIFFPFIIGYAILRYGLFNLKAVIAELLTFSIWIFLLLRALFAQNKEDTIINFTLLFIVIFISLLLIKSIRKEVKTREKIQILATELEKANVQLKELDQQKSEFVSLASHQLRGPLTAIRGYASMLLEGDFGTIDKPEMKDAVEKIATSTGSLVVLVGDYLDVSRIEQGRMQYDFSTFDLRELVSNIIKELEPSIQKSKLDFKFDFDPSANYKINADMGKIKQVIGNIVDNSIKYTPLGGIHIWMKRTDDKLLITISDTGVGIKPEVLPRLFEKFTRAPDASKTNIMGTGLGLFVAKKMIEAHSGRIWAESAGAGKGSTFFIELKTKE